MKGLRVYTLVCMVLCMMVFIRADNDDTDEAYPTDDPITLDEASPITVDEVSPIAVDEASPPSSITAELETRATVSLTSHQRLFRAETLLNNLSPQLNLDMFGNAWNRATVDQRKDMITVLLEDDDDAIVPSSIYDKKYSPSVQDKMSLADDSFIESQSSLLELYDGMQDIHRLIFLQESLWPKLDQESQDAIYSFLEVDTETETEAETETETGPAATADEKKNKKW